MSSSFRTSSTPSPGPITRSASRGMSSPSASGDKGGLRKRKVSTARTASGSSGGGILRFYTEDSPGLKIGPTVVLVMSLLFISFVVLLHIWGKFHRG